MRIGQENSLGENRVVLIDDDTGLPVFLTVWRDIVLNAGDIVSAKVTRYHPSLHGYFLQTDKGAAFLPDATPLYIGETITVQVVKESRLDKDATVTRTDLSPAPAQDIAETLAKAYHTNIQPLSVAEMDEFIAEATLPDSHLKNGAELHIEQTRIGWTIDVDSGTCTHELSNVNISVIPEIARQIKLKNMAGLILIDFAGSKRGKNRYVWQQNLTQVLADDPRTSISGWTQAGLFEIQRQRTTSSVWEAFGETPVAVYYRIMKKKAACRSGNPVISAHPLVVDLLARHAGVVAKPLFDTPIGVFDIKEK